MPPSCIREPGTDYQIDYSWFEQGDTSRSNFRNLFCAGLTVFFSILLLHKRYRLRHFQAVLLVVLGVALAAGGELGADAVTWVRSCGPLLTPVEFLTGYHNQAGVGFTGLACLLSSLKAVWSSKYLHSLQYHPMQLLSAVSAYASIQMVVVAWVTGELDALWHTYDTHYPPLQMGLILLANGVLAFMLNLANFMTTKKTSALTVTVGGNVKHVVTIVISVIIFQNSISAVNGLGIALAAVGAAAYSYVEYLDTFSRRLAPSTEGESEPVIVVSLEPKVSTA